MQELDLKDLTLIKAVLRKFPLEEIEETYFKVCTLIQKHERAKDEK